MGAQRTAARGGGRPQELLARADAELLAAQYSAEPWERFSHAHLAGLRAAAAVVARRGAPGGRGAPRTVWGMVDAVAPELADLAAFFADGAALRSAVDAGRFDRVTEERAERTLCLAEDLVDAAHALVAAEEPVPFVARSAAPRMLAVRAS
ncbi:colicin transporter [Cellulomonas sp. DKR-3]|uniref:Colicin transporter n=1 Tax=Cellulomonas fulva TaxID=2835530 RepID=A0ABS5U340_9CELL|nr:SAV_6107 family HEPN domain-containing protein [Cellulomonas fulva]MBT0995819.1 colicin transporter [Cellulomonas fulva]